MGSANDETTGGISMKQRRLQVFCFLFLVKKLQSFALTALKPVRNRHMEEEIPRVRRSRIQVIISPESQTSTSQGSVTQAGFFA